MLVGPLHIVDKEMGDSCYYSMTFFAKVEWCVEKNKKYIP